jgi:hypothetical protein
MGKGLLAASCGKHLRGIDLKDCYPKIEYFWTGFVKDTGNIPQRNSGERNILKYANNQNPLIFCTIFFVKQNIQQAVQSITIEPAHFVAWIGLIIKSKTQIPALILL